MFALRDGPPEQVTVRGKEYCLTKVFKHDFWAATCLYERSEGSPADRIVVKFGRTQAFCGIPLHFYSRWLAGHESRIYGLLDGIPGVPKCYGCNVGGGIAIEYVDGVPLDHLDEVPSGFFDRLRELFEEIHKRGIAYCDANKKSNMLVSAGGDCFLIDYQIAISVRDDWPWPLNAVLRAVVRYMASKDIYHILKHKRRMAPEQLLPSEESLSKAKGILHRVHRRLGKPYRALRRRFLRGQHAKGALESPTAGLESHLQPEKDTWRRAEEPEHPSEGVQQ